MSAIISHFPQATSIHILKQEILKELQKHELAPSDTIWGTSVCSDEVNNSLHILSEPFAGPGPFRFGGISGLPFTGETGFRAFASHIPDGGNAFILYGPHIGFSNGTMGEIKREAMQNNTTCCGSLIAGWEAVKNHSLSKKDYSNDQQQEKVNRIINKHHNKISEAKNPVVSLTDIAYQHIRTELLKIIDSCSDAFPQNKILLIGGIIINTDWDKEDYFEIRDIDTLNIS